MSSFSKTLLWPLTSLLKTKCPYQHLALEDSLLHRSSDYFYPLCLIYKNASNVSLGRSQCVWTEVHLPTLLTHEEITLSRRFSGGGTVFQDEETLNFSFISSHKEHNPQQNLFFLQSFLESLGMSDLEQTSRFDLLWQGKKITGSAFRKTKENTLHHFTLLWKTNLSLLRKLLFFSQSAIGLGTLSKRQEVANIGESYQIENLNLSSDELIKRLIEFHSLSLISCEN